MSSSTKSIQNHLAEMGFIEKLTIVPKVGYTLANVIAAMFTGLFRSGKQSPDYYRYIMNTAIRTAFSVLTLKQQQYVYRHHLSAADNG